MESKLAKTDKEKGVWKNNVMDFEAFLNKRVKKRREAEKTHQSPKSLVSIPQTPGVKPLTASLNHLYRLNEMHTSLAQSICTAIRPLMTLANPYRRRTFAEFTARYPSAVAMFGLCFFLIGTAFICLILIDIKISA